MQTVTRAAAVCWRRANQRARPELVYATEGQYCKARKTMRRHKKSCKARAELRRRPQRGGLQLIYQLGFFRCAEALLLFFQKNAKKKVFKIK